MKVAREKFSGRASRAQYYSSTDLAFAHTRCVTLLRTRRGPAVLEPAGRVARARARPRPRQYGSQWEKYSSGLVLTGLHGKIFPGALRARK